MKAFLSQKAERGDQEADGSRVTSVASAGNLVVRFECYSRRITVSMAYKSVRSTLLNASRLRPARVSQPAALPFFLPRRGRAITRVVIVVT